MLRLLPLLFAPLALAQPAAAATPVQPLESGWSTSGRWADDRWLPILRVGGGQVGFARGWDVIPLGEVGAGARYRLARYQGRSIDSVALLDLRSEVTYSLHPERDSLAHSLALGGGIAFDGWLGGGLTARGVGSFAAGREASFGVRTGLLFTIFVGFLGVEVSYDAMTLQDIARTSAFIDLGVLIEAFEE